MMRIQLVPPLRDIRMHTRYTAGNVALLVLGVLLCLFDFSYTGLILDAVRVPEKGWLRMGVDLFPGILALGVLAMLAGFRWPKIASTALWTLTFFFFLLAVAVHYFPVMVIPAAILAAASALASLVEHLSGKAVRVER